MRSFVPRYDKLSLYLRLGRFHSLSGAGYLFIPCWWGVLLASAGELASGGAVDFAPSVVLMLLFAVGALFMRACGCAWNDLLDRKIDAQTARTRDRPLASGTLSVRLAVGFILVMASCGGLILLSLVILAPNFLLLILAVAVVPLAMLYPLAKRVTYFPQVFLGCVFNWGVLCGVAAVHGELGLGALLLFAGGVCWTTVYDTIYAFQDLADDKRTGMRSLTFLLRGNLAKIILCLLYGIFLIAGVASVYLATTAGDASGDMAILGAIVIMLWLWFLYDIRRLNFADATACMKFFRLELWRGGGGMLCVLLMATIV